MKRLKTFLTSRTTVLALLVALAIAMTAAALVPQTGHDAMGGKTGGAAPPATRLVALVRALGLDHVFSAYWFAGLSLVFVTSLTLSTVDQLQLARARMRQLPGEGGEGVPTALGDDALAAALKRAGYRRLSQADGRARYVRHWQGYWGNFLLHAGMTLTVLFAVVYVLTEHRGNLHVVSGVTSRLVQGSYSSRRGLLARPLPLPAEVRLYRVDPVFGVNDQLIDVGSTLVFTDPQGTSREVRVAVNDFQDYRGLTVYQLVRYGHAFFLELGDGSGTTEELKIEAPFPAKRGAPSYVNQPLEGERVLKAKYYASADHSQLVSDSPQLVLRLQDGDRLLGEATLETGQVASLGPLSVRLARVGWWTEILFEGSRGTTGIFLGFGVLMLGSVLIFFVVPREVIVRRGAQGCTVQWRTGRFSEMFVEERDRVLALCTGGRVE